MPGIFLSLDGLDGTGKSTQCDLLADRLRGLGFPITQCVDPGGTIIGQRIRDLLLDNRLSMSVACEMFLFMASRAQLTEEIIRPALAEGHVVISDRYLLANVVYQGCAGGLDVEALWSIGQVATGGLLPDATIVLDIPIETAAGRRQGDADRMENRDTEFHERVRQGFLQQAKRQPNRIHVISAAGSLEEVHDAVYAVVSPLLGQIRT